MESRKNKSGKVGRVRHIVSFSKKRIGSKEIEFHVRNVGGHLFTDKVGSPLMGPNPPLEERFFGQAVTSDDGSDAMSEIMERRRKRALKDPDVNGNYKYLIEQGREFKSKNDSKNGRQEVYDEIDRRGLWRTGFYIDHRSPPMGWTHNGTKNRRMTLEYTVDRVLRETEGDAYFVVDKCDEYGDDYVRQMIRRRKTPDRDVDGDQYDSEDSEYAMSLQAQDYSNRQMLETLRDWARRGNDTPPDEIDRPFRIRRIDDLSNYSKSKRSKRKQGKQKKVGR